MPERRALAAECERRARAGVSPVQIREDLGVSYKVYSRWAKLYGFRQEDLFPQQVRAGARVSSPAGPGGWIGSGRYTLGLGAAEDHPVRNSGAGHPGWTGGDAASRERYGALRDTRRDALAVEVEGLAAGDLLPRVRERMEAGDYAGADRLLAAWRAKLRREAGLAKLEAAAEAARAADFARGLATRGRDQPPDADQRDVGRAVAVVCGAFGAGVRF